VCSGLFLLYRRNADWNVIRSDKCSEAGGSQEVTAGHSCNNCIQQAADSKLGVCYSIHLHAPHHNCIQQGGDSKLSVCYSIHLHAHHACSSRCGVATLRSAIHLLLVTVFIPGTFFWGGELSPSSQSPQMAAKLRALNLFWPVQCYKYITETFFKWTINTGNHSSLSNQKAANLCLKCTKIRLAAGLCPDALREFMCSPRPVTYY